MGRTHDVIISGFDLDRLEAELDEMTLRWERTNDALFAERALADRLVKVVEHSAKIIGPPDCVHDSRWETGNELDDLWNRTQSALSAWKEARSE